LGAVLPHLLPATLTTDRPGARVPVRATPLLPPAPVTFHLAPVEV